MSIKRKAYIAGAFEHPARRATGKSVAQLHAEVAKGAIEDARLTKNDVDGYFCAGDAPGMGPLSMLVMAAMQTTGRAPAGIQINDASQAGIHNMGGAAVVNYLSIIEAVR